MNSASHVLGRGLQSGNQPCVSLSFLRRMWVGRPQCTCPDMVVSGGQASTPAGGAAPSCLTLGPGPYLKVDVSVGEAVGTALVEEVDVFDEQAEEGNDDLEGTG